MEKRKGLFRVKVVDKDEHYDSKIILAIDDVEAKAKALKMYFADGEAGPEIIWYCEIELITKIDG